MGEEKDYDCPQSSDMGTFVRHIHYEMRKLVHFPNGISIRHLQPNLPHELIQQQVHVPCGGVTIQVHFLPKPVQIVDSNTKLEKELIHKYVVSEIESPFLRFINSNDVGILLSSSFGSIAFA